MAKTEEKQKKQPKKKTEGYFYQKWWFWVVIGVIFAGTWAFLFVKDMNLRSSIIGICGVWGSTIATIFIGIIAAKQSERYTLLSRKQSLIDAIRAEQNSFLTTYSEISGIGQYVEVSLEALFVEEDEWEKKLQCAIKYTNLLAVVEDFSNKLTTYWYSPTGMKQMQDACNNFLKFLKIDLNVDALVNTSLENAVAVNKKLVQQYLEHLKNLRKVKNVIIVEMQYLIRIIAQSKNMKELQDIENKISRFNKENYKTLFEANELKNQEKEKDDND